MSQKITSKDTLLIVESPSKSSTISGYLPSSYEVIATYGHIANLKRDDGSVLPEEDFKMIWEYSNEDRVNRLINKAKEVIKNNGTVLLGTDPDREGEAISFHVQSLLKSECKRVLFNEISKDKIIESINNPISISQDKVDAYFARIAIDYLIGFTLSPILWRKLKGCKSAGRVQSAVLRAIIDRESEVISFKPEKYWTLDAKISVGRSKYNATLNKWMEKPLEKFMWTENSVKDAAEKLKNDRYEIAEVEIKEQKQNPNAPHTTSTMHQEASSKYGWSSSKTSLVAQALYEGVNIGSQRTGLVTYIRTDSVRISDDALAKCASFINKEYGKEYSALRKYSNKSKTVQDGHEAIRPVNFELIPDSLNIDPDHKKLYTLIWNRAVASQMSQSIHEVTNIFIKGEHGEWKVHGRKQIFDGFLKLYPSNEEKDQVISSSSGDVKIHEVIPNQHETQPRPRFTESSLIKYMDEVGIGRPSTYSNTIKTIQARNYVNKDAKKRFVPTTKGWVVTGFLDEYCPRYIQDDFTAEIEDDLDLIAEGKVKWKGFTKNFWDSFKKTIEPMSDLNAEEVVNKISSKYDIYFFGGETNCPKCGHPKVLRLMPTYEFVGCSNYPSCDWKQVFSCEDKVIGEDYETGESIVIRLGKYGRYLHWITSKKNVSISEKMGNIDIETAMMLKNVPILIGKHPHTGDEIKLSIGRYGPYLLYNKHYVSCSFDNFKSMNLDLAMEILNKKQDKSQKK